MPKPKKKISFRSAAEGLALVEGVEISFEIKPDDGDKKKGLFATAKFKVVEHSADPESNGIGFQDTYPLWVEFGEERFLGLACAMFPKGFKEDKDYPMGYFNDKKIQAKLEKQFGGIQFGTLIRHDRQLKKGAKTGSTNENDWMIFAKLGDVLDKEEYKEALKEQGNSGSAAPVTDAGSADAPSTDDGEDGW